MRILNSALALALVALAPASALAQSANSDYTTKAGDDCVSVAIKAYGDRRAVELIHQANPWMGPVPHVLKPGTVLHLPPKGQLGTSPDARVTFVRNKVTVQAAATKSAEVNDPLFRTNRVSTANASSANVTFRDETQIRIGEESLVIILGDVQGAAKKQPADATLVSGALQARLGELSGKRPLTVETGGGAKVTMSNGEAVVGVDAQKTTRLAVHGGSAAFAAALSTVTVAKGFGSKAENGKPPTPPRPLPAAPVWSSAPPEVVFADAAGKARVVARYGDSALPGKPKAASFRVRVARDPSMDDLVSDTVVPAKVTELDAQNLPVGAYFLRVSTIDDDKFESPVGPIAKVVVASAQLTETTPGLARLSVSPSDVVCTIDGAAGTTEVDGTRSHGIVCQLDARDPKARGGEVGKAPGTVTLPAVAKPLELRVSAAERGARDGEGRVTIDLAERSGAPASAEGVEVTATNGVTITRVDREGTRIVVHLAYPSTARPFVLRVQKGTRLTESPVLHASPTHAADSAPSAPRRDDEGIRPRGFEVGAGFGLGELFSGHGGRQLSLATAYRTPLSRTFGVALGPSVTIARFDAAPIDPPSFDGAPPGDVASHTNVVLGFPVALRLFPSRALSPYVAAAPELALQRASFAKGLLRTTATGTALGGRLTLGGQAAAGPGFAYLEGSLRGMAAVASDTSSEPLTGASFDLGYRLAF